MNEAYGLNLYPLKNSDGSVKITGGGRNGGTGVGTRCLLTVAVYGLWLDTCGPLAVTEIDVVELVEVVPFCVVNRVPFLSDESGWSTSCVSLFWPLVRRTGGI